MLARILTSKELQMRLWEIQLEKSTDGQPGIGAPKSTMRRCSTQSGERLPERRLVSRTKILAA
jgi:hypothetical protein